VASQVAEKMEQVMLTGSECNGDITTVVHRAALGVACFKLMKSNKQRQNTGRDLLLYIAIALLIAAVAGGYGFYLARKGEEPNFRNDWSVTIATAALVFGYAIRHRWRLRKFWSFWAIWFALLVAHFAILLPILSRMEKVPLVLIGLIAPLEVFIVYPTLNFVVGHLDSRHS